MVRGKGKVRLAVNPALISGVEKIASVLDVSPQRYVQEALRLKLAVDARYRDAAPSGETSPDCGESSVRSETWQRFLALADYIEVAARQVEGSSEHL